VSRGVLRGVAPVPEKPEGDRNSTAGPADVRAGLDEAGTIISVTRSVPLGRLAAASGGLSLSKLRDLVSELKAGHLELSESALGDLELCRRGDEIELRMYFLPRCGLRQECVYRHDRPPLP